MTTTKYRLWTLEEYHQMIDFGILTTEDKVELLDGKIIQMSPQKPPHAGTTQRVSDYFKLILAGKAHVRTQLPITLSSSEPEPDIAVVEIDPGAYGNHHPSTSEIFLLIEVSYSTIEFDCEEKALIYAKENIREYWVLDIIERQVYVYRNPSKSGYQQKTILNIDDAIALGGSLRSIAAATPIRSIAPLAFPELKFVLKNYFFLNN